MKFSKLLSTIIIFASIILVSHLQAQKNGNKNKKQPKKIANSVTQKKKLKNNKVVSGKIKPLSHKELSQLKAVIVVGPVEDNIEKDIERAKVTETYLRGLGVKVTAFYPPNDKWNKIVTASKDANIFLYSGHGTTCGENGKPGGLCLSNKEFIYSKTIISELKLHKNALVLFNCVCLAAGSSAGDNSDIGVNEAINRVSDYSQPFIKLGAGGYYVNNYLGSMVPFLEEFFKKRTIKKVYSEKASEWCKIETIKKYKYDANCEVSVASNFNEGFSYRTSYINGVKKEEKIPSFKEYSVAFAGRPNFTVNDFFK